MLCNICPRKCNVDRENGVGVCKTPSVITISRAMKHFWEEPSISGERGSGAIFFSGCNLNCIYCQNYSISNSGCGKTLNHDEFKNLLLNISQSGVHNINLVTPTHFTLQIYKALKEIKSELQVPIVWNSSGYESVESIKLLSGLVDIYLCDIKYKSPSLSLEYSNAPDYFDRASETFLEMIKQCPLPVFDENGILKSGVIVRHLVLPGAKEDSKEILSFLSDYKDSILLSLMSQYTPTKNTKSHPKLSRRTTSIEYNSVVKLAEKIGFQGYVQEKSSAICDYTPDFTEYWDFKY